MIGIASGAVTQDFRIDFGATRLCMVEFLQKEYAGTFAGDKTLPIFLKRTACPVRFIIPVGAR